MQEDKPLTQEMIQHLLDMRAKGRHERATRLYQAEKRGREIANITAVKNMLNLNFPVEAISQAIGLSIDEIKKLK